MLLEKCQMGIIAAIDCDLEMVDLSGLNPFKQQLEEV